MSIFLSQILLARWMGGVEFGIYVYAWTWLQMVGDIIHLGLPLTAQRIIPEYTQRNDLDGLRGFLIGSRWIVFVGATAVAILGAFAVHALEQSLDAGTIMPLYLACVALPLYPVSNMLDGLARPYNAVNIALLPPFVLRPLMLIAAMAAALAFGIAADATTAMAAFAFATWTTTLVQLVMFNRCLARKVPAGPRRYDFGAWIKTVDADLRGLGVLHAADLHRRAGAAPFPPAGRGRALLRGRENPCAGDVHPLLGVGGGRAPVRRRTMSPAMARRSQRSPPARCAGRSGRRC